MSALEDRRFWLALWDGADTALDASAQRHLDHLVLDTIAIAMHARGHGVGGAAVDARAIHPLRKGSATIWGGGKTSHPLDAALLNGTAAEVLDFQEVMIDGRNNGHAAVVIAPALVALAEERKVSVSRLRGAVALALRANFILLRALGRGHRAGRVGFRTTSLAAPVAAAFAGAYLLGTDADTARQAAALAAAALPAGLLAAMDPEANSFSTDKDTAVGLSAQHAVHSVLLAENGATGPEAALTGARGWFASYGFDSVDLCYLDQPAPEDVLQRYQIKRFPVNFGAQAAVRCALALAGEVDADAIDSVDIRVKESSAASLRTRTLSTHVAARFSLPYAVSSALVRGRSVLGDFEADALSDPDVLGLMERCTIHADAGMEADHRRRGIFPARVVVRTNDGRETSHAFEGPWNGLSPQDQTRALEEKWASLVGDQRARALRATLANADEDNTHLEEAASGIAIV